MMIEDEMYGMMPSAKIVARENAPPTNRSYSPNRPPDWLWNAPANARAFTPGVGMCSPRRYTTNSASVNRIRRFSSGTWKMLRNFSSMSLRLRSRELHAAAGRFDRLRRAGARRVDPNRQCRLHLAASQQLDRAPTPDDALGLEPGAIDHGAGRRRRELHQVQHLVLDAVDVREPALGQAPLDGHLPTLEPHRNLAAGARLVTL